jgi:hypothetical protein
MSGFRALLGKELGEQVRTLRLVVLVIVFASFGILSPVTARYLPGLINSLGADQLGIVVTLPPPSLADAVDQLLKNVSQFGILAAILLAMGSVATEKDRGTAAFVLSKPASRAAFLAAKVVAVRLRPAAALSFTKTPKGWTQGPARTVARQEPIVEAVNARHIYVYGADDPSVQLSTVLTADGQAAVPKMTPLCLLTHTKELHAIADEARTGPLRALARTSASR